MLHCLTGSQANLCGEYNKAYQVCKRERDVQIFRSIKDWELEHFHDSAMLSQSPESAQNEDLPQRQQRYLEDLKAERQEIVRQFESTPSSIANKHKRWRMAADIEQLQWRHQYLLESLKLKE